MPDIDFTLPWCEAAFGRKKPKAGELGVEIESEFRNAFQWNHHDIKWWRMEPDGSLRNHGMEFIINGPIDRKDLEAALAEWTLGVEGNRFVKSPRTSVHVHFNMQAYSLPQILTFACAYWLVEEWLMPFCGPSRKGNMFCLTNSCSDNIIPNINRWLKGKNNNLQSWVNPNAFKYSGLNLGPLIDKGSVEVRTMRGLTRAGEVIEWVDELRNIRNHALQFANPLALADAYKRIPKDEWLAGIFSPGFIEEVNALHPDPKVWRRAMDKAFFDLLSIANAPDTWEFKVAKAAPIPKMAPAPRRAAQLGLEPAVPVVPAGVEAEIEEENNEDFDADLWPNDNGEDI